MHSSMHSNTSNTVFVTGATGLVGSHLIFSLAQKGKKVRALKRSTSQLNGVERLFERNSASHLFSTIEWIEGDINDVSCLEEGVEGCEEVYHTAAFVSFNPTQKEKLIKVNIEGTANVVNACLDEGIKKLCYVSSTAAIGKEKEGKTVTEQTKWNSDFGHSMYGISKHYAEREVWRGMEEGLNVVVVNPCIILGPGNWGQSSSTIFQKAWDGLKYYTKGSNAFVDVRDVVKSMLALMEQEIYNEKFLIVSENLPFKELFDQVADALDKKRPSVEASPLMAQLAWRVEKVRSFLLGTNPLITSETAKSSMSTTRYSNEKIKSQIGIEFIPVSHSIKETAQVFLQEVK